MSRTYIGLAVASAAAALLAVTACAAESESSKEPTAPAQEQTTTEVTTTEPEPITAAESEWLRQIERYQARLQKQFERAGAVTHLTMRKEAKLYNECGAVLRSAGDPGRYAPAGRIASRACARLDKAARLLDIAIASSGPGGTVIDGTPEAARFERSFNGAIEAVGNAQYDFERALERAEAIERGLES